MMKNFTTLILIVAMSVILHACGNKGSNNKNFEARYDVEGKKQHEELHGNTSGGKAALTGKSNSDQSVRVIIEGNINNGHRARVILDEMLPGDINALRSTTISEENRFIFDGHIPKKGLYQLRFPTGSIHLFLTGGHVKVDADLYNLSDYTVTGSTESNQLKELYMILNQSNDQVYHIRERMKQTDDRPAFLRFYDSLPIYYANIEKEKTENLKRFITRLDNSLLAAIASNHLDAAKNVMFLKEVADKLKMHHPESEYVINLEKKVMAHLGTAEGNPAPDIALNSPEGEKISLSSLKGKYVLIDFWASWCQPCRVENPNLLRVYNKYRDKNFEIYGVSLDKDKNAWIKAINDDKINWLQVSDLLAFDSPVVGDYAIQAIPTTILLDKEGRIIGKNLKAADLDARLAQLLK